MGLFRLLLGIGIGETVRQLALICGTVGVF